ncbi:MAG: hypothetical protein HQ511_00645 [Rhodospirillales bacterium]|nr:hypothetical protein [Rhodospirillales bacterium]
MASHLTRTATTARDLTPIKIALLTGAALCALALAFSSLPAKADSHQANGHKGGEMKEHAEGVRNMQKEHMGEMQQMRKEHAEGMKDGKKHMEDDHMDGAKKAEKKMKKMKGHD